MNRRRPGGVVPRMLQPRALVTTLLLSLALLPLARPDDPPARAGKVLLVTRAGGAYSGSDLERLGAAGVTVLVEPAPKLVDVRAALDRGCDVSVPADAYSTHDLRQLAGREGRITAVVHGGRHSVYDLRDLRAAGVDLELRTSALSVYDLERVAGK